MEGRFYVYLYRDPRDGTPVYVGKGCGGRAASHARRAGKSKTKNHRLSRFILARREEGLDTPWEIVSRHETQEQAFAAEIALIAAYGRWDDNTGTLFNHTPGGESGRGRKRTEVTRLAHAEQASRTLSAVMLEKHRDPEFAARRDAALAARNADPDFKASHAEKMKKLHTDPEYRRRQQEGYRIWLEKKRVERSGA